MKKITFLFFALITIMSAHAATKDDGFLTINSNMTVEAGSSVKIPVSLTNTIDVYGVQCDIYLSSADISLKVNNKGKYVFGTNADRVDGQTESSKQQTDGAIRYMLADYTAENPFYDNSGELFYINVDVAENAGGDYTVTLKNITLATDDNKILCDDIVCTITVPRGDDTSDELTIGEAGFATYYNSEKSYIMPENCQGYSYVNGESFYKLYSAGDAVPADEALVIMGASGNYSLQFTTTTKTPYSAIGYNDLKGTDIETQLDNNDNFYYYAWSLNAESDPESAGFYWMNDTGSSFKNGAHKAYLMLPKTSSAKPIYLFNDMVTAIKNTNIDAAELVRKIIVNGMIVIKTTNGIYSVDGVYLK